jgi:hypothetical protein
MTKEFKRALDCDVVTATIAFSEFWGKQEDLSCLILRRTDSSPFMPPTFTIVEILRDNACIHEPKCVDEEYPRAVVVFRKSGWDDGATELNMRIENPSARSIFLKNAFTGKETFPPFTEHVLVSVPDRFINFLENRAQETGEITWRCTNETIVVLDDILEITPEKLFENIADFATLWKATGSRFDNAEWYWSEFKLKRHLSTQPQFWATLLHNTPDGKRVISPSGNVGFVHCHPLSSTTSRVEVGLYPVELNLGKSVDDKVQYQQGYLLCWVTGQILGVVRGDSIAKAWLQDKLSKLLGANASDAVSQGEAESVTFHINTDFNHLRRWLEAHTTEISNRLFSIGEGIDLYLYPAKVAGVGMDGEPFVLSLTVGHYHKWSDGRQKARKLRDGRGPIWAIRFKVLPVVAAKRVEVVAECKEMVVLPIFWELLEKIADCWPESKAIIDSYLTTTLATGGTERNSGSSPKPDEPLQNNPLDKTVRELVYRGSLEQFQTLMQRLKLLFTGRWISPDGVHLMFEEYNYKGELHPSLPLAKRVWSVREMPSPIPGKFPGVACIEAVQQPNGQTLVTFSDDHDPLNDYDPIVSRSRDLLSSKPIGLPFDEFCSMIIKEMQENTRMPSGDDGKDTVRKRGPNIETPFKVAKARLIMELKNVSQTVACGRVPVSPHTFRQHMNSPKVLAEMGRLRRDKDFLKEIGAI